MALVVVVHIAFSLLAVDVVIIKKIALICKFFVALRREETTRSDKKECRGENGEPCRVSHDDNDSTEN